MPSTKNKYTLKLDVKKAQQALKEAEKQFEKTGDAADGLKMELAQANYDNAVRNLNVVAKAARDTGEGDLQGWKPLRQRGRRRSS